jgi:small GTP-binding protein
MAQYTEIRDGLEGFIKRISQTGAAPGTKRLEELSEKLKQGQFNLVIMGQFKRGKSTLINALLGAEVVPTSIVPLTSIITILRFGEQPKALVRYLDGKNQEIPLSEIPDFVTEKKNPENRLQVKEVEVFYPSDYLKEGVRIIDTPGVGSVFKHNTDVAYAFLPYVDAGIFIVTADPPLGESERAFLKAIQNYADKFFFVLNKTDLVEEKDISEALEFTGEIIRKHLERKFYIYPVSSRLALQGKIKKNAEDIERSGFSKFETVLKKFLYREKGKIFLLSVMSSLLRYISDETIAYKLEREAARLSLDELKEKIRQFEEKATVIQKERDQKGFILDGQLKKLSRLLDEDIEQFKKSSLPELLKDMETVFSEKISSSPGTHALEKEMEGWVYDEIRSVFTKFRSKEAEKIAETLENIYLELAHHTNQTIESIVRLASDIFEIGLKPFTAVEKLTGKSDFYFLLKEEPGAIDLIHLSIRSALPMVVAKTIILNRMKSTVEDRFDSHCGRVRYDLIRRVEATTKEFRKSLNEKTDLTLSGIRDALQRAMGLKSQSEQHVSEKLSELSTRISAIDDIRAGLIHYRQQAEAL